MGQSRGNRSRRATAVSITRRDILLLLILGILVYFLLPRVGEVRTALRYLLHANPFLVLGSLLVAATTYLLSALALRFAAGSRIPLGPTVAAQVAAAFANLTPGSVGGVALTVRYLQHRGFPLASAATALAVARLAGFVSVLLLLPALLPLAHRPSPRLPAAPGKLVVLLLVVGLLLLVAAAAAVPRLRTGGRAIARQIADSLRALVTGKGALRLVSASLALTLAYGTSLYLALLAVGLPTKLSLLPQVLVLAIAGEEVANVAPTPGGLGATEAALVSGLLIYGVAPETAVAGVLVYRFGTFWLPLAPGFVALRTLTRLRYL